MCAPETPNLDSEMEFAYLQSHARNGRILPDHSYTRYPEGSGTASGLSDPQYQVLCWLKSAGFEKSLRYHTQTCAKTRPNPCDRTAYGRSWTNHYRWRHELSLVREYSRVWSDAH